MDPTRRTLLAVGAAGAAVLVLGGLGLALQGTVLRAPARPLRALHPREFSILAAIADRICPGGDTLPTAVEAEVAEKVDDLLARLDPAVTVELSQLLRLIENALVGLAFDGRVRTFTALPPDGQDRVLAAWRTSRFPLRRQGFKALAGLCNASYWATPATWPHTGYPGPPDYASLVQGAP